MNLSRVCSLAATAAALVAAAGCGSGGTHRAAPPALTPPTYAPDHSAPTPTRSWLVADSTIRDLESAGLSASVAAKAFDNPSVYLIDHKVSSIDAAFPAATLTEVFDSYTTLASAVQAGTVDPGVKALLYDNEDWPLTPVAEQRQPFAYARKAEALAHAHGYQLIFAPAVNLASPTASKYQQYLNRRFAAQGGAVSDVFVIQSQQAEGSTTFASFTNAAAAQVHGAKVLAGLSSNPLGRTVTAAQMLADYSQTSNSVAGYWINVPSASAQCPSCATPQPQVVATFLTDLYGPSGA